MSAAIKIEVTFAQAQKLTDRIKAAADDLWSLLLEAHEGKAWKALGYATWEAYIGAEFDMSRGHAYRLIDQGKVVRAIEDAAGTNVAKRRQITEAVAREIKPVLAEVTQEIKEKVAKGADPIQTTYEVIEAKRVEKKQEPLKPKKGEPTIESLQAENAELREELQQARDNARELAALLESYDAVTAGEHEAVKEMNRLRGMLRTVEATRDQWMTTASECRREVKALQAKLKKAGAK